MKEKELTKNEIIIREIFHIFLSLMSASSLMLCLFFFLDMSSISELIKSSDFKLISFLFFIYFYCLIKGLTLGETYEKKI